MDLTVTWTHHLLCAASTNHELFVIKASANAHSLRFGMEGLYISGSAGSIGALLLAAVAECHNWSPSPWPAASQRARCEAFSTLRESGRDAVSQAQISKRTLKVSLIATTTFAPHLRHLTSFAGTRQGTCRHLTCPFSPFKRRSGCCCRRFFDARAVSSRTLLLAALWRGVATC